MKVLIVAPFRDGTGWAHGAVDTALALDAAGVDVVPRCVRFNERRSPLPERLRELETRPARGIDAVVQYTLPPTAEYHGGFARNVSYYFVETSNFRSSGWARHVNSLGEAWVPTRHNLEASRASGVTVPCHV